MPRPNGDSSKRCCQPIGSESVSSGACASADCGPGCGASSGVAPSGAVGASGRARTGSTASISAPPACSASTTSARRLAAPESREPNHDRRRCDGAIAPVRSGRAAARAATPVRGRRSSRSSGPNTSPPEYRRPSLSTRCHESRRLSVRHRRNEILPVRDSGWYALEAPDFGRGAALAPPSTCRTRNLGRTEAWPCASSGADYRANWPHPRASGLLASGPTGTVTKPEFAASAHLMKSFEEDS